MKIAILVARIFLGLVFLVFGLNGFLNFIQIPEMPKAATELMGILYSSGWLPVVKALEIVGGLLLLSGRLVPLGLTILAPIVVNILLFHALLDPGNLILAIVMFLATIFLIWAYRPAFIKVFEINAQPVV